MRLFALLGGGWSINFSQQTLRGNTLTRVRGVAPVLLGRALSLGPGSVYKAVETAGDKSAWVEAEIERRLPSSENFTIGSACRPS